MKIIKISSGNRKISVNSEELIVAKVQEALNEHRNILLNRLLSDVQTYISYRFNVTANTQQMELIKGRLESLKNYAVDLNKHSVIVDSVMKNEQTYVKTEAFYREFDEIIAYFLGTVLMPVE